MREIRKIRSAYIAVLTVATLIVAACANIGSPDGGPYDETPPVIVNTTPKYGAAKSKATKIVLEFDENIKIENASEKVIVSPPQIEQPEISSLGKKITIQLVDSVKPNVTYTIDFSDAIEDNNEGNPMGDYAFTFSTGDTIDTMQVSGYVLDASNLEPVKGIYVGLYEAADSIAEDFPDSVFKTKPFDRISRTDSRGHFVVKGLNRGKYRTYALKDQDQSYSFTQKSEMLAFNDQVIKSTCKPDIRYDTIWHDSIHYDSIVPKDYTHFYPDDIVLLAFTEKVTDHYFLKMERPNLREFTLFYTSPADELPIIKGLNFNSDNAFVIEPNPTNDTIKYWIRDSLIYNLDTLVFDLSYMATDSLGKLVLTTDSATELISKVTKAKVDKQKQQAYEEWVKDYKDELKKKKKRHDEEEEESADSEVAEEPKSKRKKKLKDEDIEIPPMPEEFLEVRTSNSSISPVQNMDFSSTEPIVAIDTALFHFREKIDSVYVDCDFKIRKRDYPHNTYRFYAEWQPGHTYEIAVDTGAFVSVYGKRSESFVKQVKVRTAESFGSMFINLHGIDTCAVVELINSSDKPVKKTKVNKKLRAEFYYVEPGTYYLRTFCDRNGNGIWDTGSYDDHLQAEEVYYYPGSFVVRANWDISQEWWPKALPVMRQKPTAITKQKADKEKDIRKKNAERLKEKNKK